MAFDEGMCTEFFRMWNEYIPDVVQDTDHVCQKLVFNINIYFALYPMTHGNQVWFSFFQHFYKNNPDTVSIHCWKIRLEIVKILDLHYLLSLIKGCNPQHLLRLSMLYFLLMLQCNCLLLIELTHKVTRLLRVWRTRFQATQNVMRTLYDTAQWLANNQRQIFS